MSIDEVVVNCYGWRNISRIKNLCDYDYVLINLLSVRDEKSQNGVDWNHVDAVLSLKNTLEVLRHKGMIVVVGDPRFLISVTSESKLVQKPFLDWTGMLFVWDNSPGNTTDFLDRQFPYYQDYIDRFKSWSYSLTDISANTEKRDEVLRTIDRFEDRFRVRTSTKCICRNRYGKNLIFEAGLYVTEEEKYRKNQNNVFISLGSIVFLPPIDASEEETLLIALYRVFGIKASSSEPQWLTSCIVPNQEVYSNRIEDVKLQIQELDERLEQIQHELQQSRNHLKLLYARDFDLEIVVREIFKQLGANVEEPQEENKEDGWIAVKGREKNYEGVLEVKSTSSTHFKENGIRQLLEWIQRGITFRQKKYKGIFVGNNSIDQVPKERVLPFSDSWKISAELNGICALKSVDLYVIYTLFLLGRLNTDDFWEKVFTTNGIFDAQEYWSQLPDADSYLV